MKILTIGITGHRDLRVDKVDVYAKAVFEKLKTLRDANLYKKELKIFSPLADGADRLIVKMALKLGIGFIFPLPMQKELYEMDFNDNSQDEFRELLDKADDWFEIPLQEGNTLKNIKEYSTDRNKQYEAVGKHISDNSDILFALWDGEFIGLQGGTGEIIKYRLESCKKDIYYFWVEREKSMVDRECKFKIINSLDDI